MAGSRELEQIIAGCRKGVPESFSELIDIYSGRCYGYFYRLTGSRDASDELLSELFVKLVEKIASYKGESFDGWLFRIASNLFCDYLRSKKRREKLLKDAKIETSSMNSAKHSYDNGRISNLQEHLHRLDPDTRDAIMLRFYSQLSFKEVAKIRREPLGTTLSKVHRGLKKLRKLMEQ